MAKGWLIIFLCLLIGTAVRADPIDSDRIHVIDGDTIRVAGTTADVRLVGFNAPETTGHDAPKSARSARRRTGVCARSFGAAIWISASSHVPAGQARKAPRSAITDVSVGP
jgi:endonuclease YncB( thermonuclease family)